MFLPVRIKVFNLVRIRCIVFIFITIFIWILLLLSFNKPDDKIVHHLIHRLNLSAYRIKSYVNPKLKSSSKFRIINDLTCRSDTKKTNLITIDFRNKTPLELQALFHKFVQNPYLGRCPRLQRYGGVFQESCRHDSVHQ